MVFPNFPTIRNRFILFGSSVAAAVKGLIQWLSGEYYVDGDGYPVDGTILDKSAQEGGYPNIASGYALEFGGVSDKVDLPLNTYDLSNDFTVVFWLYKNADAVQYHAVYQALITPASGFQIFIPNTERLGIFTTTASSFNYVVPLQEWVHLSVTVSGTNATLYVNGIFEESILISAVPSITKTTHNIGNFSSDWLNGSIAAFSEFTLLLTPDQIQELYEGALRPTGITEADVALDLRIIEGAGSLVKDYSTNGNDGTISGASWLPNIPYGQQMAFAGHNVTQNLVVDSEDLTTSWLGTGSALTVIGVDTITENTSNGNHFGYFDAVFATQSFAFVAVAKYNGRHLQIRPYGIGSGDAFANFDLQNGILGNSGGDDLNDSTIEDVGGGYYKCTMTMNDPSEAGIGFALALIEDPSDSELPSYLGDGVSGVLVQSTQMNQGLSVLPYIKTTDAAQTSGQFVNLAGTTDDATTDIEGNAITFFEYDADRYKLPTTAVQVFDGVDDYVRLDSAVSLGSGDFHIRTKQVTNSTSTKVLIGSSTFGYIQVSNAATIGLFFTGGSVNLTGFSIAIKKLEQWDFIRIGNVVYFYQNGVLESSATVSGEFDVYDIGRRANNERYWDGYIESVEVVGIGKWTEANGWIDDIGTNDGTVNGSPTSEVIALTYANHATPKTGIGLFFDGVSDNLQWDAVTMSGDFTLMYLVTQNISGNIVLTSAGGLSHYVRLYSSYASVRVGGGTAFNIGSDDYTGTSPFLVTVKREGATWSVYKNGVFDGSVTETTSDFILAETNLGAQSAFSLQIFTSALTPTQILELAQNPQLDCPTDLDRSNLALSLRLDDANSPLALDYSGNENHGTITGADWIYGQEFPVKQTVLSNKNLYDYFDSTVLTSELVFSSLVTLVGDFEIRMTGLFIADSIQNGLLGDTSSNYFSMQFAANRYLFAINGSTGEFITIPSTQFGTIIFKRVSGAMTLTLADDSVLNAAGTFNGNFLLDTFMDERSDAGTSRPSSGYLASAEIYDNGVLIHSYNQTSDFVDLVGSNDLTSNAPTKSLIYGNTDDATTDLFGNALPIRKSTELALPYIYHDGLTTPHNDSMNPTDGVTISFWTEYAYVNSGSLRNVIFLKGVNTSFLSSISVLTELGKFRFLVQNQVLDITDAGVLTGMHHHVIVAREAGLVEWYIDGQLFSSTTITNLFTNTLSIRWGDTGVAQERYTKSILDPMYYNRTSTEQEVLDIYNSQTSNVE